MSDVQYLSPAITVLLTSHMKPYLDDALTSLTEQTRQDFAVVVIDSGVWADGTDELAIEMAGIYDRWADHPMVEWFFTGESPGSLPCPVSCATNMAIRAGYVRGRYVAHFYDDDIYYPAFMERMAGYLDDHPDRLAVWCTQDRIRVERNGSSSHAGQITAYDGLGPGAILDRVDGGQVMYRREVLDALGDPWMPEEGQSCHHSDGIFLERVAQVAGSIDAIHETLMAHRFTPLSTYSPT